MKPDREFVGAYTDKQTAAVLRKIAAERFEGNQSMALRFSIREAAERAGVQVLAESAAGAESKERR